MAQARDQEVLPMLMPGRGIGVVGVVPVPIVKTPDPLPGQARDQEVLPMLMPGRGIWSGGHADLIFETPLPLTARETVPAPFPEPGRAIGLSGAVPVPIVKTPLPLTAAEVAVEPVAFRLQGSAIAVSGKVPVPIVPTPAPLAVFQQNVSMSGLFEVRLPYHSPILVLTSAPTTTVVDTIMFSAGLQVLGEL